MSEFMSLKASGLSDEFDATIDGEQPVVKVDETKGKIEVSYIFPGFTISDDDQEVDGESMPFKEAGISGSGFVSESGKPLLPSFGRFVQIPVGCDFQISVKEGKPVEFKDVLITPAQEDATDSDEGEFEFDREEYSRDKLYPGKTVEVSEPQNVDDYKALLIHVRPLQYNPAQKLLLGYSNITVVIKISEKEEKDGEETDETDEYPLADSSASHEAFGNLFLNPGRNVSDRLNISWLPKWLKWPAPTLAPKGAEFLIIYDENLKRPAEKLARWKDMRGLRTETVSINTVGNSAGDIKSYIRGKRRSFLSRLRYVLLFGDITNIVTEERGKTTTDHYYYTSRDPIFSECLLPWVSGGRIPVETAAEGMDVVRQIIRYERRPPADPQYYRRMTVAAYFQDDSPQDGKANRAYMKTMEGIRRHMITQGFDVERVYVSNNPNPMRYKDGTPVPADVRSDIVDGAAATKMIISDTSQGQLIIAHRDHGSSNGWAHPPFVMSHLGAISGHTPSMFYSINCLTGKFDQNLRDCFAEAILALNGGAPSLIAATELSGTWRNDSMMKALFDAMWPGVIPTFPGATASYPVKYNRLGDILNYAKSYLLVAHGSNSGVKNHFEIYHVVGDPTLQLWEDEPAQVSLNAGVSSGVLRIKLGVCPKGATVTVWHRGDLLKRINPSSRWITINLRDLRLLRPAHSLFPIRRPLSVCFAAPGCRFAQVSLRV